MNNQNNQTPQSQESEKTISVKDLLVHPSKRIDAGAFRPINSPRIANEFYDDKKPKIWEEASI